jgi:hypothetical protein
MRLSQEMTTLMTTLALYSAVQKADLPVQLSRIALKQHDEFKIGSIHQLMNRCLSGSGYFVPTSQAAAVRACCTPLFTTACSLSMAKLIDCGPWGEPAYPRCVARLGPPVQNKSCHQY